MSWIPTQDYISLVFILVITFKFLLAKFAEATEKPQMAFLLGKSVFGFSKPVGSLTTASHFLM